MGLHAFFAAHAEDAQCCADGIQIRIFMAHDQHAAALTDQLHQGVGGHAGTDLAALLRFFIAAAVEIKIQPVLYHRLVTTAAQRHFDGQGGKPVALLKGLALYTQTEGDGCGQACRAGDCVDVLQNRELILDCPLQVLLFKNEQIAVSLQAAEQAVIALRPLGDGIVDLCIECRNCTLTQIFYQLFVVIHQYDRHHGTGTDILIPHLIELGQICEVQRRQLGLLLVICLNGRAVNAVAVLHQLYIEWILCFAGNQPLGVKARQNIGNVPFLHCVVKACQLQELVIGKDDAAVCHPYHNNRKGRPLPLHAVLLIQGFLHEGFQLFPAAGPLRQIQRDKYQPNRQLNACQRILLKQHRRPCKKQQKHKIDSHIGVQ